MSLSHPTSFPHRTAILGRCKTGLLLENTHKGNLVSIPTHVCNGRNRMAGVGKQPFAVVDAALGNILFDAVAK